LSSIGQKQSVRYCRKKRQKCCRRTQDAPQA